MTYRFEHTITPDFTEFQLVGPNGPVPVNDWAIEAPDVLLPGVDIARRLCASDGAIEEGATLFVEHPALAPLTQREGALLGLPPLTDAVADITTEGVMTRPGFKACLTWRRPTGQAIVGPEPLGAWLRVGETWRRLPDVLFTLAQRIDTLNAVST